MSAPRIVSGYANARLCGVRGEQSLGAGVEVQEQPDGSRIVVGAQS